jgi:hypothetical protein
MGTSYSSPRRHARGPSLQARSDGIGGGPAGRRVEDVLQGQYIPIPSATSATATERSLRNLDAWLRWILLSLFLPLSIVIIVLLIGYSHNGALDVGSINPVDLSFASLVIVASTLALTIALPKRKVGRLIALCSIGLVTVAIILSLDVNTVYFSGPTIEPGDFSTFPGQDAWLTLFALGFAIFIAVVGRVLFRTGSTK